MISIGNLAAGGRAKTPLAALVAARLRAMGERPSILSRGYARRDAADGVVVVRDPGGIRADVDRAGDEPMMLARSLDGVAVLSASSRYLAGRLAEHHFGCTVHVLDDGFQHFGLHRDADLLVVSADDLKGARTLPSGRLRESVDAASAADALIALEETDVTAISSGRPSWRARRRQRGSVRSGPSVAVAGIASPSAFFRDLKQNGWTIVREMPFRDHHRYSPADVAAIFDTARTANAPAIVTTEKDLVRLLPFRPFPLPVVAVPLAIELDRADTFDAWLTAVLEKGRA